MPPVSAKTAIVVTSIAPPNAVLCAIAGESAARDFSFYVVGDEKSPPDFAIDGCRFYGLEAQRDTGFRTAALCPTRHYARKNAGYLLAIRDGAEIILETDDDNLPGPEFYAPRARRLEARLVRQSGWVNIYRYFSDALIWPRGLPLDAIRQPPPDLPPPSREIDCPIQQGLADENPDVDAIYRLALPLPFNFSRRLRVALGRGSWCPFNSQNTAWWPDAYPLLYLPAYCSFRMTDIWRSFIAQRIAWQYGWSILFHEATVTQGRNEHDLMRDFADEVPGYLQNRAIAEHLAALRLDAAPGSAAANLRVCYQALAARSVFPPEELTLLDAWLADLDSIRRDAPHAVH